MNCPSCITLGSRLHCDVSGHGPRPLLFLHGFAASSVTWEELRPFFPPDIYTLYLLDLKGSGQSAKPRDGAYRPEDQAHLVLTTLEGLGIRGVTLVGHSLGGGIALLACHIARQTGRSTLVSRLVLIDAAAYPQPFPRFFRLLRRPVAGWLLLTLLPLRMMVRYNLSSVYHDPEQATEARIRRYMDCFRGSGTIYALIASARQVDAPAQKFDQRQLQVPTLIIWGRHDRVIRLANGERLHHEIAGSRLAVFDCGHNPHEEAAAECAAALRDFLEDSQ